MSGCSKCKAEWGGNDSAHCAECHTTFTGIAAFDAHRHTGTCTAPPSGLSLTIPLVWTTPPLSMNDRHHWAAKARITRDIRETTRILAIAHHIPRNLDHVTVSLHYAPKTNRRINADNLSATLKPCCDGLVDHGLVPDDEPRYMAKLMPVIHPKSSTGKGQLWLQIEVTQ